jgi:hypothetical protein
MIDTPLPRDTFSTRYATLEGDIIERVSITISCLPKLP